MDRWTISAKELRRLAGRDRVVAACTASQGVAYSVDGFDPALRTMIRRESRAQNGDYRHITRKSLGRDRRISPSRDISSGEDLLLVVMSCTYTSVVGKVFSNDAQIYRSARVLFQQRRAPDSLGQSQSSLVVSAVKTNREMADP